MTHLIYDPETGTVLGTENALLVRLADLKGIVGPEADTRLSEEDPEAQGAAQEVGKPLRKLAEFTPTSTSPLNITLDHDKLKSAITDSIEDLDSALDDRTAHSLSEIISTGINNLSYDGLSTAASSNIADVDFSAEAVGQDPLSTGQAVLVTAWFNSHEGSYLTNQAVYHLAQPFEIDVADERSDEAIIIQIHRALVVAVSSINHNTAADFSFYLKAL